MYIPDEDWDSLNTFCCDLVEQLEAMPEEIFFACKKEATQLCHIILNTQDTRPPNIQWVSAETPPITEGHYLVLYWRRMGKPGCYMKVSKFFYGSRHKKGQFSRHEFHLAKDITHWAELPSPPLEIE